jgi:acetyl esterase
MDDDVIIDPAMAAALARADELFKRFPAAKTVEEERRRDRALAPAWANGAPAVASVEPYAIPSEGGYREAVMVRPLGIERPPLCIYIHGGGWNKGSIAQSTWLQHTLAAMSGHAVLSISYRLAPESPYPAALNDVDAALDWAFANLGSLKLSPATPSVTGASAGANLALCVSLLRRDKGKPLPSALGLFYGMLGSDFDTPSFVAFGDGRFRLSRARIIAYFDDYIGPNGDRNNPLVAPNRADLAGLCPVWLSTAEIDVLRDDTLVLAERLAKAGVRHKLVRGHGLTHGYCNSGSMVPQVKEIVGDAARFLAGAGKA